MSGQHETARQQSKAAWGAVAPGWYAQREELWKASRPVSEWMIRKLDPQSGHTVLELGAGLADTGLMAARLVGELRRLVLGICATLGIEALVWLTDMGGLSREEAVEVMRSNARTLLRSALERLERSE
jgi:hypothetical protein